MKTSTEADVENIIQQIMDRLSPGHFGCRERKTVGQSVINKPADLEIYFISEPERVAVAVEVSNVNTTQIAGECCRLYFDSCPIKLLVLCKGNTPPNGQEQCERILSRLYGQDNIQNTPARVAWYSDKTMERVLKELLLL